MKTLVNWKTRLISYTKSIQFRKARRYTEIKEIPKHEYQCHLFQFDTLIPVTLTIDSTAIRVESFKINIKLNKNVQYYITNDLVIFVTTTKKYIIQLPKQQCIDVHIALVHNK